MKLTILGCSGSVPGPDSVCSSYLLQHDGFRLLLDAGTGATGPLLRHIPPGELDAIFVSHMHGDHAGDLLNIWYHKDRFAVDRPPIPVYAPDTLPMWEYDYETAFAKVVDPLLTDHIGPLGVRLAPVQHVDPTWAIRIDDKLCYTADTAPCPELDELAGGCEVVLAEAARFDADEQKGGHLSAGDAGRLAASADARLLIVTHIRPWHDASAILDEAAAYATCPVIAAHPHQQTRF
jgi:ribonuclease BN (tRNA processing enzyme)